MRGYSGRVLVPLLMAWFVLCGRAAALCSDPIKDDARLFSPEARQKALAGIKEIQRDFKIDLCFHTFAAIPKDRSSHYPGDKNPRKEARFFDNWAKEQAAADEVDGILVLICQEPPRIAVAVHPEVQEERFSREEQRQLKHLLVDRFGRPGSPPHYDEGLEAAVSWVHTELAYQQEAAGKRAHWIWIASVLLGALGLWLILALALHKVRGRTPEEPGTARAEAPASPGTVTPLGGYWLYHWLVARQPAAEPTPTPPAPPPPEPPAAERPVPETAVTPDLPAEAGDMYHTRM